MSEKTKDILCTVFITCFFVICICLFTRCDGGATSRAILEYQQQVDRLEEELRNRDRTIETTVQELERITNRSEAVEGTIDEVIELFDEYQRRVEFMLQEYRRVQTEGTPPRVYNHRSVIRVSSESNS